MRLELRPSEELAGLVSAEPVIVPPGVSEVDVRILPAAGRVRAPRRLYADNPGTAVQKGDLPVF